MSAYQVPQCVPSEIDSGSDLTFQLTTPDYPTDEGWNLTLAATSPKAQILITSTPVAGEHQFTVSNSDTAKYVPGNYQYTISAADGTSKVVIKRGSFTVNPDLSQYVTGYDARTVVQKVVDALEAYAAGDTDATNLMIISQNCPDFSANRRSLYDELAQWRQLLSIEKDRTRMESGGTSQRVIYAQFTPKWPQPFIYRPPV